MRYASAGAFPCQSAVDLILRSRTFSLTVIADIGEPKRQRPAGSVGLTGVTCWSRSCRSRPTST
jgi:hypothetical protein